MQDSQIPTTKFVNPFAYTSPAAKTNPIPTTANNSTGAAGLDLGFPPVTALPTSSGGIPPTVQDFNGVLFQISAWVQWFTATGGIQVYDATFSTAIGGYPKGSILAAAATVGNFWISTVDNNASNPDTGGANWISVVLSGGVPTPAQFPVVGAARNLKISITGASATATVFADEIWVEASLVGAGTKFNATAGLLLNLATTGAGAMDTGSAPASGFINIYAISGVAGNAVLAQNAATNGSPSIYGGSHMPAGYSQSSLLAIVPTNGSSLMQAGVVLDRHWDYQVASRFINAVTGPTTLTEVSSIAGLPTAARTADVIFASGTATLTCGFVAAGDSSGTGMRTITIVPFGSAKSFPNIGSFTGTAGVTGIPIITPQAIWWAEMGGETDSAFISGYSW